MIGENLTRNLSEGKKRFFTAIFLLLPLFLLLLYPVEGIIIISAILIPILSFELYNITSQISWIRTSIYIYILTMLMINTNIYAYILVFIIIYFIENRKESMLFIAYFSLFFFSVIILSNMDNSHWHFFYIVLITATTDTFSYIIGKKIGKSIIFPKISPKKTLEGFLGGIFAAMLVSFLYSQVFSNSYPIWLAFILSITTHIGDLLQSYLKRCFHKKDSGNILPGHGGFFDRIDGLVLTSIVFFIFFCVK